MIPNRPGARSAGLSGLSLALVSFLSIAAAAVAAEEVRVPANSASIRYMGRVSPGAAGARLVWSGTSATIAFKGTGCKAVLNAPGSLYTVYVDGEAKGVLAPASAADTLHALASGLAPGPHTVTLSKRTEVSVGTGNLIAFLVDGTVSAAPAAQARRIEFVGNSITCGYGALDSVKERGFSPATEDHGVTYAALAAKALGAEHHAVCWSGKGLFRNNTGDTAATMPKLWPLADPTRGGEPWGFAWKPHVVVIDLGTNDFFLAPPPDSAAFVDAGVRFIAAIREKYPAVPVVLADGPMLGDGFPRDASGRPVPAMTLVRRYNRAIAAVVAASGGGGVTVLSLSPQTGALGYGADWHPTAKQHRRNSRELIAHLARTLGWGAAAGPRHGAAGPAPSARPSATAGRARPRP